MKKYFLVTFGGKCLTNSSQLTDGKPQITGNYSDIMERMSKMISVDLSRFPKTRVNQKTSCFNVPDGTEYEETAIPNSFFVIDKEGEQTENQIYRFYRDLFLKDPDFRNGFPENCNVFVKQVTDNT